MLACIVTRSCSTIPIGSVLIGVQCENLLSLNLDWHRKLRGSSLSYTCALSLSPSPLFLCDLEMSGRRNAAPACALRGSLAGRPGQGLMSRSAGCHLVGKFTTLQINPNALDPNSTAVNCRSRAEQSRLRAEGSCFNYCAFATLSRNRQITNILRQLKSF